MQNRKAVAVIGSVASWGAFAVGCIYAAPVLVGAAAVGEVFTLVTAACMDDDKDNDKDDDKETIFYHYTDKQGAEGIRKSGKITESSNTQTDAALGQGVYVTTLTPETIDKELLKNNYDSGWKERDTNNVSYYVKLVSRGSRTTKKRFKTNKSLRRDVYVHQGDIVLKEYNGEIVQRIFKSESNCPLIFFVVSVIVLLFAVFVFLIR